MWEEGAGGLTRAQPQTNSCRQLKMLSLEENSLPQRRAPKFAIQYQVVSPVVSPEIISIQVTLYKLIRLYLYI